MRASLDEARHRARPDDLASLRRLEQALHHAGWRLKGKSPREWLAQFLLLPTFDYDTPYPLDMMVELGLAAVPCLVDALRTKRLDTRIKRDTQLRAQCVEALARMKPAPTCAVPALLETLQVPNHSLRHQTLWTLARLRPRPSPLAVRTLIPFLGHKNAAPLRAQAARTLSKLDGALPAEVRLAALSSLTDPHARVRRQALQILDRLPESDREVRTALEEQVVLDDDNRFEALRILMRFDAPRALALMEEELQKAEQLPYDRARMWQGGQALQLITRWGAKAHSLLPRVSRISCAHLAGAPVETAIDAILRGQLFAQAPTPDPSSHPDERISRLLGPLPSSEPTESPARVLARWAAGFLPLGHELCVRIALAAARRVVVLWDGHYFLNTRPREGLFAMEDWVCDPNETTAAQALQQGYNIPSQLSAPDAFAASWTITYASTCVLTDEQFARWKPHTQPRDVEGGYLGSAVYTACRALQGESVVAATFNLGDTEESSALSAEQSVQEVRRAIVDEVLPWLLGTWDPVRAVHQRRREWLTLPQLSTGHYP